MKGRIKVGAAISQDFGFGRWPNCKAPKGSKDPNTADDPDMVFEMKWNGRMWECTAPGFGAKEWYGNGSIFVFGAPSNAKSEPTSAALSREVGSTDGLDAGD